MHLTLSSCISCEWQTNGAGQCQTRAPGLRAWHKENHKNKGGRVGAGREVWSDLYSVDVLGGFIHVWEVLAYLEYQRGTYK